MSLLGNGQIDLLSFLIIAERLSTFLCNVIQQLLSPRRIGELRVVGILASVLRPACRKAFNPKINPKYSLKLGRR